LRVAGKFIGGANDRRGTIDTSVAGLYRLCWSASFFGE